LSGGANSEEVSFAMDRFMEHFPRPETPLFSTPVGVKVGLILHVVPSTVVVVVILSVKIGTLSISYIEDG
jgi:hypothetical protein